MFSGLPHDAREVFAWTWADFEPFVQNLLDRPLTAATLTQWMNDWTHFDRLMEETKDRLYVATTVDTTDRPAEERFGYFLEEIYPKTMAASQALKEKFLASALEPENFSLAIRNLRAISTLFREANLPLLAQQEVKHTEYDKIVGAQTVEWGGEERTLDRMRLEQQDPDRNRREQAWRLAAERQLADRPALNELWARLYELRRQMATNAGMDSFREYKWQDMLRFDYMPEDCASFRDAIRAVVVPAARRRYALRQQRLGLEKLRPWDTEVDVGHNPPLRPFNSSEELISRAQTMFDRIDPQLGAYFNKMVAEGMLDLDNRKGKAPGGYCMPYVLAREPFIFMNSIGVHDDVQTILHEGGHAFHVFESAGLPYLMQDEIPMEFAEVASTAMELLAAPYLPASEGGFYTGVEAARARIEFLERSLLFLPYMAVVDGFQDWAYTHPDEAVQPELVDSAWAKFWDTYMEGIDYTGLEEVKKTGWQRKLHIFLEPLYYVEYGLALLGAVQVWANARKDQAAAVAAYRRALALGGTVTLPELFAAAGARFAFDTETLREAVDLMESTISELEKQI